MPSLLLITPCLLYLPRRRRAAVYAVIRDYAARVRRLLMLVNIICHAAMPISLHTMRVIMISRLLLILCRFYFYAAFAAFQRDVCLFDA